MKHFREIALFFCLCTGIAEAAGIGGGSSGGAGRTVLTYDSRNHLICVPGELDEHMEVALLDSGTAANLPLYSMSANDFAYLQQVQDSLKAIDATSDSGILRSYRVTAGDEINQVVLIDRRAAIRNP